MRFKILISLFIVLATSQNINSQACGYFDLQFSLKLINLKPPYKIKIQDFEHPSFNFITPTWVDSKKNSVEILWHSSLGNPQISPGDLHYFKTLKDFTLLIEVLIAGEEYLIKKIIKPTDYTLTTDLEKFPNKLKLTFKPIVLKVPN